MQFREEFLVAIHCMRVGRLRTALTMLGIVISVSLVIVMVGLGNGLEGTYRLAFNSVVQGIGISPTAPNVTGGNAPRSLHDSDIAALRRETNPSAVAEVMPIVGGQTMMRRGSEQYGAAVVGSTASYLRMESIAVVAGVTFTDGQYRGGARVVLIGMTLVNELFDGNINAAIGSKVIMGRQNFEVIGVLGPDDPGNNTALMPATTARERLFGGMHTVQGIGVIAADMLQVSAAVKDIKNVMDRQHYIKEPGQRDFGITYAGDERSADMADIFNMLRWFASGVTGIALFIGALGLANIMLVTVTERTNEIGVRRALGARRGTILRQFLTESVIIAGLGGLFGVACGIGAILASRQILPKIAPLLGKSDISIDAVLLAFGISLAVGFLAGGYPAVRAARLCPWDAIRY
ncbi:ABC transporter permease [Pseudonocardia sp. Cha107L01]|uniref:ABC transporter permease n=1 Tax=Pseudonocardia sp. Cha107L01 TaxID=3457576 RepID=UPI00403E3934